MIKEKIEKINNLADGYIYNDINHNIDKNKFNNRMQNPEI